MAERHLELNPDEARTLYLAAGVLVHSGNLEKAIQNGFGHREWIENDSDLDNLRAEPRFEALKKRL